MNTHPEQWAAFYAATPGEQLGVRCLAQERGIEDGESAGYSFPPLTIPADYKCDSNHFATTSHWGYHKCLWYKPYIYTHINTFSTLFSTILYNLSYRNTNIPYILPKIIQGNYLKAHKWTVLQRFCFLFWQIKKKTFIFFIFVQWKSCNLVFWLFFPTFFFVFFIVPSPICFSFWSASLFQNFIYIYCTETLWLTSLNLYCGAWIEDIWNVTLTSDLHLLYPQLLARSLNPEYFISILFHCVLLCTCAHFFTSSSPTAHINPWFRV